MKPLLLIQPSITKKTKEIDADLRGNSLVV